MKISIITPSFNQGRYIERTVRSVLDQRGDFELEYLVVDGGSTDNTLDILRRFEPQLRWQSGRDEGQSDALNKGFRMATGEVLGWLNSDDTYQPGALARVAQEYRRLPFAWCFGHCGIVDEEDRPIRDFITRYKVAQSRRYSYRRLLRRDFISQPSAFFSAAAYRATGEISRDLMYSMDYDYWLRLGKQWEPRFVDDFLANFRWHTQSKNGAAYRKAAWETFQTARRHAKPGQLWDLSLHLGHCGVLNVLYRLI
jgi:glycosyltransferase involved in cell wall biosynthesis